jgi:predicted permease
MRKLRTLWTGVVRRGEIERQLADELAFHIEARAADLSARFGFSPAEALRRARLEFGSLEKYKEEARASRGLRLADELRSDIRFARRTFVTHKGFVAAAVSILALGIGINTAVFSVVDAVLLSDLPVDRPADLVAFDSLHRRDSMLASYSGSGRPGPDGTIRRTSFSARTLERFREGTTTLSDVFAFAPLGDVPVAADDGAEMATAQVVSGAYHRGLGARAAVGRTLGPLDDRPGAEPVAVVSHRYWQLRFGGDPNIVGTPIRVNGVPFEIVGVTQPGFDGTEITETVDVSVPLAMSAQLARTGAPRPISSWWLLMMGRLKPDVTRPQVLAELRPIFNETVRESWAARPPQTRDPGRSGMPELRVLPGAQGPNGPSASQRENLTLVFTVTGIVLLIACGNVASLLLVRAAGRRQEMTMRRALGATRGRLIRQMLSESLLLAALGAAGGVTLAEWAKDWLPRLFEADVVLDTAIDLRALAFAAGLTTLTALLFGVAHALLATRVDLTPVLKMAGGHAGLRRSRMVPVLIGAQMAASLVLLVAAGLFVRTLHNYSRVDVGFDSHNLLVFRLDPAPSEATTSKVFDMYEALVGAIEAVPGVRSATLSAMPVVAGDEWTGAVRADPAGDPRQIRIQAVRSNFFDTMAIPRLAGRAFLPTDTDQSPSVAIVNEEMARQVFGEAFPIGRHLRFLNGEERDTPIRVVGVVRDAKYASLAEETRPTMFRPYTQVPPRRMTVEVRADGDALALAASVRTAIRRVDPGLPLIGLQTQEQQMSETIRTQRVFALLTGIAGMIGLLLACVGLYGVISYDVRRRTNEIGVRVALGARQADVVQLIMQQTVWIVAGGAMLGVVSAAYTTQFIAGQLFGIRPLDPWTLASAVLVLAVVALVAGYLPARRAARLDPTLALRYE